MTEIGPRAVLFKFTNGGGTTADINLGSGDKPHLVKYGSRVFVAWLPSGSSTMVGQVLDASTGAAIGSTVPIDASSNLFQDFRDYPDGSVAYPAPGSTRRRSRSCACCRVRGSAAEREQRSRDSPSPDDPGIAIDTRSAARVGDLFQSPVERHRRARHHG